MANKKPLRLVVGDASWAEDIPDWLLDAIRDEREVEALLRGTGKLSGWEHEVVGDAEMCAYLMTASMRAPMPHYASEIYFWVGARTMQRYQPERTIADFMAEKLAAGLTRDEEREYQDLRRELYRKRGGAAHSIVSEVLEELRKCARKAKGKDPSEPKAVLVETIAPKPETMPRVPETILPVRETPKRKDESQISLF
jgi:hypothetical protein